MCSDGFTEVEAKVACRSLYFDSAEPVSMINRAGEPVLGVDLDAMERPITHPDARPSFLYETVYANRGWPNPSMPAINSFRDELPLEGGVGRTRTITSRDPERRIWLDEVRCTEGLYSLFECGSSPLSSHNCAHSADVGLWCSNVSLFATLQEGTAYMPVGCIPADMDGTDAAAPNTCRYT